MTTVAYKAGVLAADSLVTSNGVRDGAARKIAKHKGMLLGGAGCWSTVTKFMDWVRAGAQGECPIETGGEANGFVVMPDGRFIMWSGRGPTTTESPYFAFGSGREFALGAMAAGASAEEAVRVAIELDVYSGGPVTTLRL